MMKKAYYIVFILFFVLILFLIIVSVFLKSNENPNPIIKISLVITFTFLFISFIYVHIRNLSFKAKDQYCSFGLIFRHKLNYEKINAIIITDRYYQVGVFSNKVYKYYKTSYGKVKLLDMYISIHKDMFLKLSDSDKKVTNNLYKQILSKIPHENIDSDDLYMSKSFLTGFSSKKLNESKILFKNTSCPIYIRTNSYVRFEDELNMVLKEANVVQNRIIFLEEPQY